MRAISRRVAVAVTLPLVASLLFATLLGLGGWRDYRQATAVAEVSLLVGDFGDLLHALQAERGVSVAMLSGAASLRDQLSAVRARTDQRITQASQWLDKDDWGPAALTLAPVLQAVRSSLARLDSLRQEVDRRRPSPLTALAGYSRMTRNLIRAVDTMSVGSSFPVLGERISLYKQLMNYKDYAARERALGVAMIELPGADPQLYRALLFNLFAQEALFEQLRQAEDGSLDAQVYDWLSQQPYLEQLAALRTRLLDTAQLRQPDVAAARQWFELTSRRIEFLDGLLDRLEAQLRRDALQLIQDGRRLLLALLTGLTALLLALSWIGYALGRRLVWQIGAQRRDAERIQFLSRHDPLTGLPNRYYFEPLLEATRRDTLEQDRMLALHLLDIVEFRDVNRTWGTAVGDAVIREVAIRIARCAPSNGYSARLYGDEFAVVQPMIGSQREAEALAQALVAAFDEPVRVGDRLIQLCVRLGVTLFPPNAKTYDSLMRSADLARQDVKTHGGSGYRFYVSEMYQRYSESRVLAAELKLAVAAGQLVVLYQPKLDLAAGRITGAEALVRWNHPERGLLAPHAFITEAERSGSVVTIGEAVFTETCRQIQAWTRKGLPPPKVSVNLSAVQLRQADLIQRLTHIVRETGVDVHHLELEITESVVMEDLEANLKVLQALHDLGFSLSIDDFGTGYSSLTYLQRFPVDTLKIDKSFIDRLEIDRESTAIVDAVLQLAHGLGLRVVAEGAEKPAQLEALRRKGCDEVQGYVVSRPCSAEAFTQLLTRSQAGTNRAL